MCIFVVVVVELVHRVCTFVVVVVIDVVLHVCTFVVVVVEVVSRVCTFVVVDKIDRLPAYLIVFLLISRISELMVLR